MGSQLRGLYQAVPGGTNRERGINRERNTLRLVLEDGG